MGMPLEPGVQEVIEGLRGLRTVAHAHRGPEDGGLPERSGLYAWWMSPGAVPDVKGPEHPAAPFELLYVGIAAKNAESRATLRSRIRGQHLAGNIGSSTFRQSLAALLFQEQRWTTRWSGSRTQLSPEDNRALSVWQREHLRLAWVERPRPWVVEARVIDLMRPPLNLAGNASHPLYGQLKHLRVKLRDSAAPEPGFTGAPARPAPERTPTSTSRTSDPSIELASARGYQSQAVTAKDIEAGQVRIPRGATKSILPRERRDLEVQICGRQLTCRWDPRYGPPERSGVIRVGRTLARESLRTGDVLTVRVRGGRVELD